MCEISSESAESNNTCTVNVRKYPHSRRRYSRRRDPNSTTLAEHFWSRVDRKSDSECWLWTAATCGGRYGYIRIHGRGVMAHRFAWELANGREIPLDRQINHHCDNASCCNPAHLYLGTQAQNVLDAIDRGRHVNPNWRLRKSDCKRHFERRGV